MPPKNSRKYTDLQLACAVAESKTMREVLQKIGLVAQGGNYENIWRRIRELGLSTTHFTSRLKESSPVYKVDPDLLERAVAACASKAAALRWLDLEDHATNIRALGKMIDRLGLDDSHHVGQAWRRGCTQPVRPATPIEEILVKGRPCSTHNLKRRLIREGLLERRCGNCRASTWFGQPLTLELHHVNGDREDNRLENLQLLCGNCHSLTDTYRGRNIGRMVEPP